MRLRVVHSRIESPSHQHTEIPEGFPFAIIFSCLSSHELDIVYISLPSGKVFRSFVYTAVCAPGHIFLLSFPFLPGRPRGGSTIEFFGVDFL